MSDLFAGIYVQHYPNLLVVAQKISGGIPVRKQQWVDYRKACVAPGLQYFKDKFSDSGELGESVVAFKAARLLWPQKMFEMQPTSHNVDALQVFPFLNELTILENLKELPVYLTKAADLDWNIDPLQWWKDHSNDLPC